MQLRNESGERAEKARPVFFGKHGRHLALGGAMDALVGPTLFPVIEMSLRFLQPPTVTSHLPASFKSPANEWYLWKPSPRLNQHVKVLITFDPANYPIGFKDVLTEGDLPVVWTNTKYRMLYLNMGHGDKIFTNNTQNALFEDAVTWALQRQ